LLAAKGASSLRGFDWQWRTLPASARAGRHCSETIAAIAW
jgi:hypothetical protein